MAIAIYPGSFDPITLGHLSVIKRARAFTQLTVLVVHNPSKPGLFSIDERIELIEKSLAELGLSAVGVQSLQAGLLAEEAERLGAQVVIKGLRTAADLDNELQFASMNRDLTGVETIFLPTEPAYSQTSSSLIREVATLGGDVSRHVTKAVKTALAAKVQK